MSKTFDDLFADQWKWARTVFSKEYDYEGLIDHMTKEFGEIRKEPHRLEEWIDLIFLAHHGANAVVKDQYPQLKPHEVVGVVRSAFESKLKVNKKRKWAKPEKGKACEHIRD